MTARRWGPAAVLLALVVGIVLGERAGPSPALGLCAAALVALGCALALRDSAGLVLLCLATMCAGGAVAARALDGLARSPLSGPVAHRADATIDATLVGDPDARRFTATVLVRVARVRPRDGRAFSGGGRTVVVDATGAAAPRLGVLEAGDRVRLTGYFRPLSPYETRFRWRHAVGTFAARDLTAFADPGSPLTRLANGLRSLVLRGHRGLPEPQRALVEGFLVGDTGRLPDDVVSDFRASGLSHLVAVSGENVAFVLVLVGPALRRLPPAARVAAGLAALVVFGAMTRWEPSVLRACAMAACSMVAIALGRPTTGLRALALAVTVLLLADPFLLHSVGFALSCAASVGIAVVGPSVAARLPGPRWLRESLGVTVGAQVGVAPLLVAVFGSVPLAAVPANLLAAPLVGPLTIDGLVSGVLGGLVGSRVVASVGAFPAYVLATGVLGIARVAARVPVALDARALVVATALGSATFAGDAIRRATWRRGPRPANFRRDESRVAVPPR